MRLTRLSESWRMGMGKRLGWRLGGHRNPD
jgi:hypothetical protein